MAGQGRSGRSTRLSRIRAAEAADSGQVVDPTADPTTVSTDPLVRSLLSRCTFPVGVEAVDCAVSGGADSSALLILAVAAGFRVHAFHVDHGIRAGSEAEALAVETLAGRLGTAFSSLRCFVADGPDLEARARRARHGALPRGVLFGHTMDDQAETVMLRLLRGTGPAGLAAMSPVNHPLLGLRRAETEALCRAFGVEIFEDPSNLDLRFRRNRVRHELLPLMNDISERDVAPLLARLAAQSSQQVELIAELASGIDPRDARALSDAPKVLAAQAVREWWSRATGNHYPPDAAAIERILEVARGDARACEVEQGWMVRRTRQRLRLESSGAPTTQGDTNG